MKCHNKDCDNEGTEFRDMTEGPLCDYRYYCTKCAIDADFDFRIYCAEGDLVYAKSLVDNATKAYLAACEKVTKSQEKLLRAKLDKIESGSGELAAPNVATGDR